MSKELEALNELRENLDFEGCLDFINEKRITDIKQALERLEAIDNSEPSEALRKLDIIESELWDSDFHYQKYSKELSTIKQALLKSQEMKEESYVIYCINNYHNVYMDYRGEPGIYQEATIFNDKLEAHKFLREKGNNNDYYRWSVFNVKDLSEDQKHRQE